MTLRTRKLVGSLALCLWLFVFVMVAVAIISRAERLSLFPELLLYVVLGFAWVLPLKPLFIWMGKGRDGGDAQ